MLMQLRPVPSAAIREWSTNRLRMDRVVCGSSAFESVWADELVVTLHAPKVAATLKENHRDCSFAQWTLLRCMTTQPMLLVFFESRGVVEGDLYRGAPSAEPLSFQPKLLDR